MVVSLVKGGHLKAESITDEFVTLAKAKDVMKSLDAVVMGDFDEGFKVREENVNKASKQASTVGDAADKNEDGKKKATPKTKKRASSASSTKSSTKKKKKT